jgi:hypothetical protein
MMFREIIAICSENCRKRKYTMWPECRILFKDLLHIKYLQLAGGQNK